jgi:hypothetical protein
LKKSREESQICVLRNKSLLVLFLDIYEAPRLKKRRCIESLNTKCIVENPMAKVGITTRSKLMGLRGRERERESTSYQVSWV